MKSIVIFKYKFKAGINSLKEIIINRQFAKIFFFLLGIIFLIFIYFIAFRFINYVRGVPLLGPILILKFFEMVFIVFFFMLIFSSIISGFNMLFSSRDMNFLSSLPLTDSEIYIVKLGETIFYASWMVWALSIPVFIALGKSYHSNFIFYFAGIINFSFLLFAFSSFGFFISVFIVRIFPSKKTRDFFILLGICIGAGIYILFRLMRPERLVNPSETIGIFEYLASLNSPVDKFLPNYWLAKSILLFAVGESSKGLVWSGNILILTIIFIYVPYLLFHKKFISVSQNIKMESAPIKTTQLKKKGVISAIYSTNLKLFFRDTSQWTQLLLLVALIIVYVFNIYRLPLDTPYLKNMVAFLNISMAGFVVASICLRFVFTGVSLEGKSFWIIKASPVPPWKYITAKLLFNGLPVILVALPVVAASNIVLKIKGTIFWTSLLTIIFLTITLICMAMGFGLMYPKFDYENPVQIESSFGGFLFMVYSFFLIVLTLSIEALPVRLHFLHHLRKTGRTDSPIILGTIIVLFAIYFFSAYYSLKKGIKKFNDYNI